MNYYIISIVCFIEGFQFSVKGILVSNFLRVYWQKLEFSLRRRTKPNKNYSAKETMVLCIFHSFYSAVDNQYINCSYKATSHGQKAFQCCIYSNKLYMKKIKSNFS
ncbi:hypothetical protein C0J52_17243 [Blattella germanica]|nr:hypothetical protein C0J52_17243 [Blattella germanica]